MLRQIINKYIRHTKFHFVNSQSTPNNTKNTLVLFEIHRKKFYTFPTVRSERSSATRRRTMLMKTLLGPGPVAAGCRLSADAVFGHST